MRPTLEPGWFVLFHPGGSASVGDVVVAEHPEDANLLIIKRLDANGLVSDNRAEGSDFPAPVTVLGPVTLVLDELRRSLSPR